MKNTLWLFAFSIYLLVIAISCAWVRPYHATPVDALTEFPGYGTETDIHLVEILKEEKIADGIVLLYQYPSPANEDPGYCIATTFVTQEKNDGWRAQSAGRLACGSDYLETDGLKAAYTVGGNIKDLTTAYGVSNQGSQVQVTWSDGQQDTVPLENGVFLQSRSAILHVQSIKLLSETGETLMTQSWTEE